MSVYKEPKKTSSENIIIKKMVEEGKIRQDQADALTADQMEYLLNPPEKNKFYNYYFQSY